MSNAESTIGRPRVGLFATCLVDLFRPSVGFATVRLLEEAGCRVEVPATQTCCGQPAYNSGDRADAKALALQTVRAFAGYDYVVAPSGSCAAMIRDHYTALFRADPDNLPLIEEVAARTWEITSFLCDVLGLEDVTASFSGTATYHDSCSGLRELGIKEQPRRLLRSVKGLALEEMTDSETCCGFGGTFCVKYPDISERMVSEKSDSATRTQADILLAGDLGCLLNIAGRLKRQGARMQVRHVVEVLADMVEEPAIGEPAQRAFAAPMD